MTKRDLLSIILYYLVITIPLLAIIFNLETLGWWWFNALLLFYFLIFRPCVDLLRLNYLNRIEKKYWYRLFIPFLSIIYFKDLYLRVRKD